MTKKEKLVVIIGPTAVGKTKLSIELAKAFDGEIISGDSMQIYAGMDVGTAKITNEEMEGIPHHLIDIKKPDEPFSVAEFQELVRKKISEITARKKTPFIVGGTGLYIQSVIYDYQFSEAPSDPDYRKGLEIVVENEGSEKLHQLLMKIDPDSGEKIHHHNVRRLIRALEIYHCTGKTMTEIQNTQRSEELYESALIGLSMDRALLYERINKRVDLMMGQGLLEEVEALYSQGLKGSQALQAIGYKEFFSYFEGSSTLQASIDQLKQNSRNYAKRQLTWFRNKMDVEWFDMTETVSSHRLEKKIDEISSFIEGKLKIKSNT
nr:tRNA (adenosine(37)-N6)-dimethylallyltransferase MiaA [Bacillus sp. 03113]